MKRNISELSKYSGDLNESSRSSPDVQIIEEIINRANTATPEKQILLGKGLTLFQNMLRQHQSEMKPNEEFKLVLRNVLQTSVCNLIDIITKGSWISSGRHEIEVGVGSNYSYSGEKINEKKSDIDDMFIPHKRIKQFNPSYDYSNDEEKFCSHFYTSSASASFAPCDTNNDEHSINICTLTEYNDTNQDIWIRGVVEREFHSFCELLKVGEPEDMEEELKNMCD